MDQRAVSGPQERPTRGGVNRSEQQLTPMREWIHGLGRPKGNENIYIARYERHNRQVMEYF
jgi:hypothetical protein